MAKGDHAAGKHEDFSKHVGSFASGKKEGSLGTAHHSAMPNHHTAPAHMSGAKVKGKGK
jgi:hypothetical protein